MRGLLLHPLMGCWRPPWDKGIFVPLPWEKPEQLGPVPAPSLAQVHVALCRQIRPGKGHC